MTFGNPSTLRGIDPYLIRTICTRMYVSRKNNHLCQSWFGSLLSSSNTDYSTYTQIGGQKMQKNNSTILENPTCEYLIQSMAKINIFLKYLNSNFLSWERRNPGVGKLFRIFLHHFLLNFIVFKLKEREPFYFSSVCSLPFFSFSSLLCINTSCIVLTLVIRECMHIAIIYFKR